MRGEYDAIGFPVPPPCVVKRNTRWVATPEGPAKFEKLCPGCEAWLSPDEFWAESRCRYSSTRKRTYCKACEKLGKPE